MTICCVNDCGSNSFQKGISFFRFPKKERAPEKWKSWVEFVNSDWTPSDSSRICSLHFRGSHIYERNGKLYLKDHAIPTVLLGDDSDEDLVSNDENSSSVTR